MFEWLKKNLTAVYVLVAIVSFSAPWLFTKGWTSIDFTNTGQIGDTIGGLTAPFLNLLSVTLLYLTLKEQMKFNQKQVIDSARKNTADTLIRMHLSLKEEIHNLSYLNNEGKELQGYEAVDEYKNMLSVLNHKKALGLPLTHEENDSVNIKRLDTVFPEVLNAFFSIITTLSIFDIDERTLSHFWILLTFDYDHFKEILDRKSELTGVIEQSNMLQTKWNEFEAIASTDK